jgi:hypothetical protein
MRQRLLNNANFSRIGRMLRIEKLLVLSPGAYRASDYMVATMMEAIVGAVYLDGGMDAVELLMGKLGIDDTLLLMIGGTGLEDAIRITDGLLVPSDAVAPTTDL